MDDDGGDDATLPLTLPLTLMLMLTKRHRHGQILTTWETGYEEECWRCRRLLCGGVFISDRMTSRRKTDEHSWLAGWWTGAGANLSLPLLLMLLMKLLMLSRHLMVMIAAYLAQHKSVEDGEASITLVHICPSHHLSRLLLSRHPQHLLTTYLGAKVLASVAATLWFSI